MKTVAQQDLREICQTTNFRQTQEEIVIFCGIIIRSISPGLDNGAFAHHHAWIDDSATAAGHVLFVNFLVVLRQMPFINRQAIFINTHNPCADGAAFGMNLEVPHLASETIGQGNIIRVHHRNELGLRQFHSRVALVNDATVVARHKNDTRVFLGSALGDFNGLVIRAIVQEDQLEVLKPLGPNA